MWNIGHPNFVPYKKNERVLKKCETKGNLVIDKFKEKFEGPYKIYKVLPNGVTYGIITPEGQVIWSHYTQLRRVKLSLSF